MTRALDAPESCTITVSGMTCAACSGRVQRALEKTAGVSDASVNLMTGTATVRFDPAATSPDRLIETIRGTGYGAELPSAGADGETLLDARDEEREAEARELRRKFAVSLAAAILTMIVSPLLDHAVPGAPADPLMGLMRPMSRLLEWAMPGVVGVSPDAWRWALLGITLPVVGWAGRHFYTRAWAAFRHHTADMNTLIAVGTGSAFLFSLAVTLFDDWFAAHGIAPYVYYEAVVWIIALILLGNLLEARAKGRTAGAIRRLIGLRPRTAHAIRDGVELEIPLSDLRVGDEVLVRPAEQVPADGTVLSG
ncbi:MAG TPA: heavy metal translocating P-type ATPase, partial [Gemmatimonadales bacterium]|nr:heavy metal translocating P-type ATPase [Gemmatimonadales bacterium]